MIKTFFFFSELILEAFFVNTNRCVRNFVKENFLPQPGFEPTPLLPTYLQAMMLPTRTPSTW